MASDKDRLREDLTCAICCDLFRDPVMLPCVHHFCRSCISRYWRGAVGCVSCPQCRAEFTSKQFHTNYLVTAMVEKVRASSSDGYIQSIEKQLKESLESHLLKKEEIFNVIHRDMEKMDTIKRVGAELQARVQGEFWALQQFLQQEEACVLEQLRREQREVTDQLQRHLEASRAAVKELEQNIRVLQQASMASKNTALIEVDAAPELDMNAFSVKYMAPIQYITWRKMFKSLKPGPAPLTFDVDTAHPSIYISRDKMVAVEADKGLVPYKPSPKRFLQCVNVLAAEGFQSGRHYWEVGVGGKHKWDLGVASEGVDRCARVKLGPESGYWTLRLRNGREYSAGTQPWTRLAVHSLPQRIGVFLDCDERRVSFYDADNMSLLHSFADGPRGKAYPFFSPCIADDSQRPQPMQLLHHPPVPLIV
ncbi:Zinc-binding protein A33 [Merluccius polli]|uniref:Zinc-binding protein A33 n=1 Tax=Merluccius polli TaxID=89951 RepID=A0AA47M378_MERPO|nr:Zinc-binding protein A33 [Merluccius polli]